MKLIKLNQSGFTHWVAMAAFVLVFGAVGYRVITASHAETPSSVESSSTNNPEPLLYATSTGLDTVNQNGSDTTVINSTQQQSFTWNPSNTLVAFSPVISSETGSRSKIYIEDSNGSNKKTILTLPLGYYAGNLTWSPDGKHLLFTEMQLTSKDDNKIYTVKSNGKDLKLIAALVPGSNVNALQWSPNSQDIMFNGSVASNPNPNGDQGYLYIYSTTGALVTNVNDLYAYHFSNDAWTGDSSSLVYYDLTNSVISEINISTKAVTTLISSPCSQGASVPAGIIHVSPNGSYMAYDCVTILGNGQYSNDIFVANSNGSSPSSVASFTDLADEGLISWSNNSSALAYEDVTSTTNSYIGNIFTVNSNGTSTTKVASGIGTNFNWNSVTSN